MMQQDATPDTLPDAAEEAAAETVEDVRRSAAEMLADAQVWAADALDRLISVGSLYQLAAILAAAGLGFLLSRGAVRRLETYRDARPERDILWRVAHAFAGAAWPIATVVLLWIATAAFQGAGQPADILRIAASLTNAAIVVRLLTGNMQAGPLRQLISLVAWGIAALYIVGLLQPVRAALGKVSLPIAGAEISLLDIITSILLAIAALWVGRILGDAAQTSLRSSKRLTPSMSGLLGQVAKIALMIFAVLIALQTVGIPLTAFAVVSGAIGVGIGFGLQSIFANFISGIIILFEKSVRVGDFIELQSGVRGQVREINIRSTLVNTNDSVDILVPNEEFIKAQVINWTLRDPRRRLRIPFGVAYGTDKEVVKQAGLEAAAAVPWTDTTKGSEPSVWLVQFGDSSLNYELVVWLNEDAVKRPARVEADYNWALHTALQKHDLEIPFPQRDLNIRQPAEITVRMARD